MGENTDVIRNVIVERFMGMPRRGPGRAATKRKRKRHVKQQSVITVTSVAAGSGGVGGD